MAGTEWDLSSAVDPFRLKESGLLGSRPEAGEDRVELTFPGFQHVKGFRHGGDPQAAKDELWTFSTDIC